MKTVLCATYEGLDAKLVHVETTLTKGLPSFSIVGMASASITEAKERVKSALLSNSISLPPKRITINLSPSDERKSGSHFDLSIALMIALDSHEQSFDDWFVFGELGLDGSVKENLLLYPLILSLANQKLIKKAIVPHAILSKLVNIADVAFYGVSKLEEAMEILKNPENFSACAIQNELAYPFYEVDATKYYYAKEYPEDFADVKGQEVAKRAALISAAGFHNILFEGSPGCGKSMIAKRMRYVLPAMQMEEILDSAKLDILDAKEPTFKPHRTFRSPHHSSTLASIFGGGAQKAMIGEVGLAHKGILFFDELPHFSKSVLEALREPMQDLKIRISRVNAKVEYPSDFLFIGAMNPCPCGNLLNEHAECRCSDVEIQKYKNRLSDPFLDRVDMTVVMQSVSSEDSPSISSKELHKRVLEAQIFAQTRGQKKFNAKLGDAEIEEFCIMNEEAKEVFALAIQRYGLSFRASKKVQKVARTIADLEASKDIEKAHLLEALSYRRR
jgi:magnesium chelatase family protein